MVATDRQCVAVTGIPSDKKGERLVVLHTLDEARIPELVEKLGEEGVALGSDFDGANIPDVIGDVTGLPKLQDALRTHGYDEATLKKLCHENWIGVLERTWGE